MPAEANISRLDDAIAERNQPVSISFAELRKEVEARRDQVLDRLAVVRVKALKNSQESDKIRSEADEKIKALDEASAALHEEAAELNQMADAMLTEMHAFDRLMQGR